MIMQIIAWIASVFVFFSFFMKTMIPLRIIAIISNLTFITYALLGLKYGVFEKVYPIFILHMMLLPLNILRLHQMVTLIKRVKEASSSDSIDYLIPYMRKEVYSIGDTIFKKGDKADRLFFIQKGSIKLPEVNKTVDQGGIFGEVGLFAPENERAASAVCSSECTVYSIGSEKVHELYYQNPRFGFFLIRLVAGIVSENSEPAK